MVALAFFPRTVVAGTVWTVASGIVRKYCKTFSTICIAYVHTTRATHPHGCDLLWDLLASHLPVPGVGGGPRRSPGVAVGSGTALERNGGEANFYDQILSSSKFESCKFGQVCARSYSYVYYIGRACTVMQCMAPTSDTTSTGTCTSESRSVTDMRGSIAGTAILTAGCKPRACFAGRVEEGSELRLPVALLFALIFALLFSLCRRATYAAQERACGTQD